MLELTGDDVARLGDEDLRVLVAMLCEAELRRFELPVSVVLAGGNQTAKDGGIDVRVQLADPLSAVLDFIPRAATGYQVKCEDMPAAAIAKEMRPKGELRDSIKGLIERKGAYIIVCSKGSVTDSVLGQRFKAMREAVADQANAADLKLDFYDRDRLARWARQYVGVEMWLRSKSGATLTGWQGYGAWAGGAPGAPYLHDGTARLVERAAGKVTALSVADGIDRLRQAIQKPGQVTRLVGLAGTGKTRLAQALFEKEVGASGPPDRALVLYTDIGHSPEPNAREMLSRLGGAGLRAMVVVDNCNPATHWILAEVVRQHPGHLSLLTIEYDVADEDSPEATDVFELEPASNQVLEQILGRRAQHLSGPDRHRITDFAGGNARIALALAGTVAPGESLGTLKDEELFRRLFRQGQADNDQLMRAAEACSLVYSFDAKETKAPESELGVLGALVEMSAKDLYRHVAILKGRDLVQSRANWGALLPPALANRLASQALRTIPVDEVLDAFRPHPRLLMSFSRRLEYLHDSDEARAIAGRWMKEEQWLARPELLDGNARKLFFNLAPLDPGLVLGSLEQALAPGRAASFTEPQNGHLHQWSTLVRQLAHEPEAFDRAAVLLLTLAEQEEAGRVDCLRAWEEVFRIALSGTLATPAQRVQLLESLLATATGTRLQLVWKAVGAMLETIHISSSHDFSFGARPQGYGWQPSTDDNLRMWFDGAFGLIRRIATSGEAGRSVAREAIASHFRGVWGCGVTGQLTALMNELNSADGWPGGWTAVRSTHRFDGKQMPDGARAALKKLEESLAPKSLQQEVRTYVLGQSGATMDLLYALDDPDDDGHHVGGVQYSRLEAKVLELGAALAHAEGALQQCLPDLLGAESGRQQQFGYGLGRESPDWQRHWNLLRDTFEQTPGSPNVAVLAGFVHGQRSRDATAAAAVLEEAFGSPALGQHFAALMGIPQDDHDGDRLKAHMKRPNARPYDYMLRVGRTGLTGLTLAKFREAVETLAQVEGGLLAAMDQLGQELRASRSAEGPVPDELVHAARTLLMAFKFDPQVPNAAWRLNELAKVAFGGAEGAESAGQFAARFATAIEGYRTQGDDYGKLACTIFRLQPRIALDSFLAKPPTARHLGLRARFVSRHGPVVQCAPDDVILDWVLSSPQERAPIVAAEVSLFVAKGAKSSIADESADATLNPLVARLLEIAPDKAKVLQALQRSLYPSHWGGALGEALAPFLVILDKLSHSPDPVVTAWAHENLAQMRRQIADDVARQRADEQSFE